ncbi:MAG TPA: hypothetical protein PLD88_10200, partial [Candidatus Berkiella sp.]|nr:hypothetical protein [Candidatus Berkiella sp.]
IVRGCLFANGKAKTTTYSLLEFAKDLGEKEIIKLLEEAYKPQKVEKKKAVVTQFYRKRQSARLSNKNQKNPSEPVLMRKSHCSKK